MDIMVESRFSRQGDGNALSKTPAASNPAILDKMAARLQAAGIGMPNQSWLELPLIRRCLRM
jgi:hypothetical protein